MEIKVFSEIGTLKKVLLHRPSNELNNLTPKYLEDLLFDDIPWLPLAIKEHDAFADAFIKEGIEVIYLEDLIEETISSDKSIKESFINDFIREAKINNYQLESYVKEYLSSFSNKDMINKMISGIKRVELEDFIKAKFLNYDGNNAFIINPMPNLYFTRDPFACIGNGVSINRMLFETRRRETLFGEYIFKYNKEFNKNTIYYSRDNKYNIEGGDILILNKKTLIIGASQRTSKKAILELGYNLMRKENTSFEKIIVLSIPKLRTFMHLDTIFTQVDMDKFTIHKGVEEIMNIEIIEKDNLKLKKVNKTLKDILEEELKRKVYLIPCGGDDIISADREQWSDGSNCLAIKPGVVITYERNEITNKTLKEYGIRVITIPSSELSRGRGGPRCMSMPLERD